MKRTFEKFGGFTNGAQRIVFLSDEPEAPGHYLMPNGRLVRAGKLQFQHMQALVALDECHEVLPEAAPAVPGIAMGG